MILAWEGPRRRRPVIRVTVYSVSTWLFKLTTHIRKGACKIIKQMYFCLHGTSSKLVRVAMNKNVHFTASRFRFREEQTNISEAFKVRTSNVTMAEKDDSEDSFSKELKNHTQGKCDVTMSLACLMHSQHRKSFPKRHLLWCH